MGYVLLVTWFAYGQPPTSYQTIFDSEKACDLGCWPVLRCSGQAILTGSNMLGGMIYWDQASCR